MTLKLIAAWKIHCMVILDLAEVREGSLLLPWEHRGHLLLPLPPHIVWSLGSLLCSWPRGSTDPPCLPNCLRLGPGNPPCPRQRLPDLIPSSTSNPQHPAEPRAPFAPPCGAQVFLPHCHHIVSSSGSLHSTLSCSSPISLDPLLVPLHLHNPSTGWEAQGSVLGPLFLSLYMCSQATLSHPMLLNIIYMISVQFSSVTQSCLTLCNPMNHSTPGLPVHHQLLEFTQTHVHRVGDAIQHLILCRPLLLLPSIPPSIRVFSSESTLRMRWPKYWSFSFNISPSMNTQGWSPLGRTGWISLQSKGLSRVFSNTTVQKHQFFGTHLSL